MGDEEPINGEGRPEDAANDPGDENGVGRSASPVEFEEAQTGSSGENFSLDLLLDVDMPVRVELGRVEMAVGELLELGPGAVVELDKMAGEPAELYIRDTFFARGEVVVVDNNFGLRITELTEKGKNMGPAEA